MNDGLRMALVFAAGLFLGGTAIWFLRAAPETAPAFLWTATITDQPDNRSYLLKTAIHHWKAVDAPAANAAINALDVPEGARQILLNAAHVR